VAKDEDETLDFGEMDQLDGDMFEAQPDGEGPAELQDGATPELDPGDMELQDGATPELDPGDMEGADDAAPDLGPGDMEGADDAAPVLGATDIGVEEPEEEEEEEEEKPTLLEKIRETSPFTVMLGLALLAIVIAVACLAMELSSYNWDLSAKEYKESALAAPASLQSGLPSTTATA